MCNFILIADKFPAAFFLFDLNVPEPENFSPKYEIIPFQLNQADKVNFKILLREAVKGRWVKRSWGLSLQRLEKSLIMCCWGFFPQKTPLECTNFDYSQT